MSTVRLLCGALALLILASGCSPSLAPLYQDYRLTSADATVDPDRTRRIEAALRDAGWEIDEESRAPAVATRPRTHSQWGIYRVVVSVEAVPMGERHVRLLIHPYREYVWGRRSKMPYLTSPIRRAILPDLHRSFSAHGMEPKAPE